MAAHNAEEEAYDRDKGVCKNARLLCMGERAADILDESRGDTAGKCEAHRGFERDGTGFWTAD